MTTENTGNGENTETNPENVPYQKFVEQEARAKRFEGMTRSYEKDINDLRTQLKKFEGIDLEDFRATKEEKERLEREAIKNDPAKLEESWTKKLNKATADLGTKITDLEKAIGERDAKIKTLTVTNVVMAKIGPLFHGSAQEDVQGYVERMGELDGEQIVFKDKEGNVLLSKKRYGEPMSPEEFGDYLVELKPFMALPRGNGGSKETAGTKIVNGRQNGNLSSLRDINSTSNPRETLKNMSLEDVEKIAAGITKF